MSRQLVRSERGSGSMLMVGVMTVMVMLSLGAVCLAGYLVAVHRARSAADLAALSGAVAYSSHGDGCAAARSNARRNHARVVSCEQLGDSVEFLLSVKVEVEVQVGVVGLPRTIQAAAHAGAVAR